MQYQKFCTYFKFLTATVYDKANKIAESGLIFVYIFNCRSRTKAGMKRLRRWLGVELKRVKSVSYVNPLLKQQDFGRLTRCN